MIALPWKKLCANFILPCGENHYGFFLRCPTSFYNRPNNNLEELRFNWPAAKKAQDVSALSAIIMPMSLLFKQDGTTLMLFECVWDSDAGFAVQIYPDWEMGRQDLFL